MSVDTEIQGPQSFSASETPDQKHQPNFKTQEHMETYMAKSTALEFIQSKPT